MGRINDYKSITKKEPVDKIISFLNVFDDSIVFLTSLFWNFNYFQKHCISKISKDGSCFVFRYKGMTLLDLRSFIPNAMDINISLSLTNNMQSPEKKNL
jgi:hypothetical protein